MTNSKSKSILRIKESAADPLLVKDLEYNANDGCCILCAITLTFIGACGCIVYAHVMHNAQVFYIGAGLLTIPTILTLYWRCCFSGNTQDEPYDFYNVLVIPLGAGMGNVKSQSRSHEHRIQVNRWKPLSEVKNELIQKGLISRSFDITFEDSNGEILDEIKTLKQLKLKEKKIVVRLAGIDVQIQIIIKDENENPSMFNFVLNPQAQMKQIADYMVEYYGFDKGFVYKLMMKHERGSDAVKIDSHKLPREINVQKGDQIILKLKSHFGRAGIFCKLSIQPNDTSKKTHNYIFKKNWHESLNRMKKAFSSDKKNMYSKENSKRLWSYFNGSKVDKMNYAKFKKIFPPEIQSLDVLQVCNYLLRMQHKEQKEFSNATPEVKERYLLTVAEQVCCKRRRANLKMVITVQHFFDCFDTKVTGNWTYKDFCQMLKTLKLQYEIGTCSALFARIAIGRKTITKHQLMDIHNSILCTQESMKQSIKELAKSIANKEKLQYQAKYGHFNSLLMLPMQVLDISSDEDRNEFDESDYRSHSIESIESTLLSPMRHY